LPIGRNSPTLSHNLGGYDAVTNFQRRRQRPTNADAQDTLGPLSERGLHLRLQRVTVATPNHCNYVRPRDNARLAVEAGDGDDHETWRAPSWVARLSECCSAQSATREDDAAGIRARSSPIG